MVSISCLCSLTMVSSHFTAPQSPPMNWWLPIPCLQPSSLSGFQTFVCNCLLNISTWVSYRHLKLNVQNCTLTFPSQTCSHVGLISADDSSIHLVAQAPDNSRFHRTVSVLVTTSTGVAHTEQMCIGTTKVTDSMYAQSCLTLCQPRDCSPPGSSVHGIFQARNQERVATS